MDKILEALSKLLPEDQVKDISEAVAAMIEESKGELQAEFDKNLDEAYDKLHSEVEAAEKTGEAGYQKAWEVIADLRNRMEVMRAEYESQLDEGYEEAFQEILSERGKNEKLEQDLYEAYEKKYKEAREYMIDKVDAFLKNKGKEIYEMARRDILSDPSMVEHKIVLEKIVESVSDYITEEDRVFATSSKLDETKKALEEAQGRIRLLEGRNIRLGTENSKLDSEVRKLEEAVKASESVITESRKAVTEESKKARVEKAKNATGRGETTTDKTRIVEEYASKEEVVAEETDTTLVEMFGSDLHDTLVLAGARVNK